MCSVVEFPSLTLNTNTLLEDYLLMLIAKQNCKVVACGFPRLLYIEKGLLALAP